MLFNKSIFAVAIVALANVVTATTVQQTPACVLKIIGNQPNPADSKTICGSGASKIQSAISKNCADSETSLKFFASNCAQLGHKVVTDTTATSTGTSESSTATGFVTAVSSATQTGSSVVATGTGTSAAAGTSGVSTGTASESGAAASPTSTFNAASSDRQFSATTFVAAVFLGAAALL
ncbi:hypothetical protein PENPOL_c003G04235 [Penicillium polonicum]|uniref:Extracellular membrane protein CFEM domain-containing protein n=1 Tax=Penicillium polonicum TaxID=60169 RepID=A0A1V6NSK1_PENPO|nr:hypothetical protein N7465_001836 [Penicillium sp. CMV-2018d]KAJ5968539.1 hypothetical protein N7501_004787 [Penicillium viridicatum]OQD67557.1 hypothetical protein PENPOL_c003G04235 [Penicillium polonicum]